MTFKQTYDGGLFPITLKVCDSFYLCLCRSSQRIIFFFERDWLVADLKKAMLSKQMDIIWITFY